MAFRTRAWVARAISAPVLGALIPGALALVALGPASPANAGTIVAEVVALDQPIVYNRFGAFSATSMVFALERDVEKKVGQGRDLQPGQVKLKDRRRPRPLVLRVHEGDTLVIRFTNLLDPAGGGTRTIGIQVSGLESKRKSQIEDGGANVGFNTDIAAAPGDTVVYKFLCPRQGTFFLYAAAGTAGGEDGLIGRGLFGAVNVEPPGTSWYRSQVAPGHLERATVGTNPDGTPILDYEATFPSGLPVLNMVNGRKLVYSDLTAIIARPNEDCNDAPPSGTCGQSFREFTIVFHDEIGIQQAFPQLRDDLFHGVRDAFAINYGTGSLGAPVIANRMQIGPGANSGESKFEEFFLESWVNGDPALVLQRDAQGNPTRALYSDDPSNVYHSYLGDPVRFRNLHAGPDETHVFHLHAHQWLGTPREEGSTYLDSQTISPGTGFTYEIQYGGTGNRNFTPGDSIFHCHLYPHFAQGMWALWRAHDVFESGRFDRRVPDGEVPGGIHTPAIVPIPDRAMPPLPTNDFPGYPFYIPGVAGHRAPQPPLEMEADGGLPRHVIHESEYVEGPAAIDPALLADDVANRVVSQNPDPNLLAFAKKLTSAEIELLPAAGTALERNAMAFHDGTLFPGAVPVVTPYGWPAMGYPAFTAAGDAGRFLVNGLPAVAGAPYADPCPPTFVDGSGAQRATSERHYRAAYVQFDMQVNALGWHDRQARIVVLEQDVAATLDGTRPPEPLFFRANSGDCVIFHATNLMPSNLNVDDFQIFTPTDVIGQHIHLVKFDVTSSDGSANGFNYEDGAYSADEVRERIEANNEYQIATGGNQILEAEAHPVFGSGPSGSWVGAQTTIQRWWADPLVDTNGADRTIRTVFTHDHLGPSSHQQHGLYAGLVVEPTDSVWESVDGQTIFGTRADGGPTSFAANIIAGANGEDSYRELMLEFGDLVPLYDRANRPIGSPGTEAISTSGGSKVINYRNEPVGERLGGGFGTSGGNPAYAFSSAVHGDPGTFVFDTYPGDPVQVRWLQGSQGEQHTISLSGHRWLFEPSVPNSGYVNAQAIGISEHFEWLFDACDGLLPSFNGRGTVDHWIGSTIAEDANDGIWGLLRAHDTIRQSLATLPNNTDPFSRPAHPLAGDCPTGPSAPPVREFSIEAWRAADLLGPDGLVYNAAFGFHDPDAIVFVHQSQRDEIIAGTRRLEPLVMRVNAGDCVEVKLRNNLPNAIANQGIAGARVGFQPQLLAYDPGRDASRVGFNRNRTVPPGKRRSYTWYAGDVTVDATNQVVFTPVEFGVAPIRMLGDWLRHPQHGAAAVMVVEPEGSQFLDPYTGVPILGGYAADIADAGGNVLFREFVLQIQDGVLMRDSLGRIIEGSTGKENLFAVNFAAEPVWSRLGLQWTDDLDLIGTLDQSQVLSSTVHGDPATPVCEVDAGTPTRIRIANVGAGWTGEPHRSFTVAGHGWQEQPFTADSTVIGDHPQSEFRGTLNGLGPLGVANLCLEAGGDRKVKGDYLVRAQDSDAFTNGCWCLLRVQ